MAAKQEISALALSTNHDIIIVDPEREYGELVRALGGDRYEITTEALRIVYEHDGFPFGLHNFAAYYKLNGKEKKFTNRCIFRNNLGGPVETLDRVTGEIPMQDGLLSRDGWYVIDDERSDLLVDGFPPSMDAL